MTNKLIGFIGAPGSGKTTLACAMKEYALINSVTSDVCTEYAREFSYRYGISSNIYAQYRITFEQEKRENLLLKGNNEYIFSDSPIWLGYIFSLVNLDPNACQEIKDIVPDMYQKFVIDKMDRYYKVFYLINSNPINDGCRDMKINKKISDILEGFVSSHEYILPLVRVNIKVEDVAKRKEFVWKNLVQK